MLFMQKFNSSSPHRISAAISVAILFHTLLGVLIFQVLPETENQKTIPVQLTIASKASSAVIQTQANNSSNMPEEAAEEILNKEKYCT